MEGTKRRILTEDRRILRSYLLRHQQINSEEYHKLDQYLLHENAWRGVISILFFIAVELFRVYDLYHLSGVRTDFAYYWYFIAASLGIIGLLYILWTFPYKHKKRLQTRILCMYMVSIIMFTVQEMHGLVHNVDSKENFYCCIIILMAFSLYPKRVRLVLYGIPVLVLTVTAIITRGYFALFYVGIGITAVSAATLIFNFACSSELRRIRVEIDNQNLKQVAYIDTLTQIQNRRGIEDYINVRLKDGDVEGYLYYIDVDNFKDFNDTYGHNTGDEVLRQVANTLHGVALRHNCKVCRYGGEEFLIVMPFQITIENARKIGEEIVLGVSKTEIYETESKELLHVTVSVGCSGFVCDSIDELELYISHADEALYYVKQNGKNGFHISA